MLENGFEISKEFVQYIVAINIVALFIVNYFSKNEFSAITLILAPIASGIVVYALNQLIVDKLNLDLPWLFIATIAFFVWGFITFFVMGFDSSRHSSNMVSVSFFGFIISLLIFAGMYQFDLFSQINAQIQSLDLM